MRQKLRDYIFESKNRVKNQDAPVFSVTNDKGFIPSNDCFDKVVHSKDIANYKEVSPSFLCYNPSRINVGSIALNTTDQVCAVSPMYTVFGCDAKKLLPEYLLLFLKSAVGLKTINSKTLGTVRFQLKFDYLKNIDLRIPNIQEQRRIIATLEEIDDLRRKQRKAIELTRQMIPALFYEMFGDPTKNNMNWDLISLQKAIVSIAYGCSKKASEEPSGLPMIRMNNVTYEGDLELGDLKYVNLNETEIQKFSLKKGDVLFNRTNSRELVGKTAVWDEDISAIFASYFIRLQLDQAVLSSFYFSIYMNLPLMKHYLKRLARGAVGQANINAKELSSIQVMVPPIELQRKFTLKTQECLSLLAEQERALEKLDALFETTLNQFFCQNT